MIAPDANPNFCLYTTVTTTSQQLSPSGWPVRGTWLLTTSVACYIAFGANPTASAANGSFYIPPNTVVEIDSNSGAKMAIVALSTAGVATLARRRA